MKKIIFLLLLSSFCNVSSQDYFRGEKLYCKSENAEAMRLFKLGIEALHLNTSLNKKLLDQTGDIFFKAYSIDSTFCDAAFFTGYTMRLLNNRDAVVFYYMADSLSNNKSVEFKLNLASEALKFGNQTGLDLSRKKYSEIKQYFPENPEGYYGYALTSTMIGDVEKGLIDINVAIGKYQKNQGEVKSDTYFLKAILLTLNQRYTDAIEFFEKSKSKFKNDENYKIHYSLALLKTSELNDDDKMKRKAKKTYESIKNKNLISKDIKSLFNF